MNSVIAPVVVILPTLLRLASTNHTLPSGPAVTPSGLLSPVGRGYSVKVPEVVTFPILFPVASLYQMLPSGPSVMCTMPALFVGTEYRVMVPDVGNLSDFSRRTALREPQIPVGPHGDIGGIGAGG